MDAVFRPGIDTPFSATTFDNLSMGEGSIENTIVLDEEQDKKSSPPQRFCQTYGTPRLHRSRPFGARIENVPDYVFRKLFQQVLLCFELNYK